MLTQMRKGASSWPAKLLLGVIALSFVLWGMGGVFTDRNVNVVAEVGDVDLSIQELQYAYRSQLQNMQAQGMVVEQGTDLSRALAQVSLDGLIQNTLYRITAEELGVTIGDDTVRADIAGNALFHDDKGQFDGGRFITLLQSNGLSEASYVAMVRQQIADSQLQNGIGAVPPASATLLDLVYAFRNETRVVDIAVVPNADLAPAVAPEADELEGFFDANAELYQAPEYRSADYILVYPADLAAEMTVTEEEIQAAYAADETQWRTPERRHVERLAFEDEQTASEAAARLAAGEDFAAVGSALGSDVLDMGTVTRDDLFGDLAGPVFALAEGETSAPVASPLGGWLIFRVVAVEPESASSLDDVRDDVSKAVALEKAHDALYDLANDLDDLLAAGDTVAEAASTLGVELRSVERVAPDGSGADPLSLQVIPGAPEFLGELGLAEEGFPSPVVETSDGGLLTIELTAIEAARPLTFEEAEDQVMVDWREAEQAMLAREAAQAAFAGLAPGVELGAALPDLDIVVTRLSDMMRTAAPELPGVGLDVVGALFAAQPDDIVILPAEDGEALVIARLVSVTPASPGDDADGAAELRDALTSAMIADIGDQFRTMMRSSQSISVDRAMIEQYF